MKVIARWLSILFHPFVTATVLVTGTAVHFGSAREALSSALLVGAMTLLPLALLMIRQVRKGSWSDVDASDSAERPLLFGVAVCGLIVLLPVLLLLRSGSYLVRGTLIVLLMVATCAVITKWLKVSLHMAFGALATTALLFLRSPVGWVLLAAMFPLAWSRFMLKRHSTIEILAGLLTGTVFGYALVRL